MKANDLPQLSRLLTDQSVKVETSYKGWGPTHIPPRRFAGESGKMATKQSTVHEN